MNKAELVEKIEKDTGLAKKDVDAVVKSFIDSVESAVASGDDVQLIGFGTFSVGERAERDGRNPKTGETIKIPAAKTPKFKAGKAFKDLVNK